VKVVRLVELTVPIRSGSKNFSVWDAIDRSCRQQRLQASTRGLTLEATGPQHLRRSRLLLLCVRVGRPVRFRHCAPPSLSEAVNTEKSHGTCHAKTRPHEAAPPAETPNAKESEPMVRSRDLLEPRYDSAPYSETKSFLTV